MSAADDDTEKHFDPTPKKLADARKKGEVAKSADLNTAATYAGFLIACLAFGATSLMAFGQVLATLLAQSTELSDTAFAATPLPLMGTVLWSSLTALAPWFLIPGCAALLSVIAQQAFVVAPDKIAPRLNRISPIAGAKNKFGRQGLFEFAKSAVKLAIFGAITGVFLWAQRDRIIATMALTPEGALLHLGTLFVQLLLLVLIVSCVIGGVDYLWQAAEHIRKNRMSRKEIMDEMKQSEGDPMLKQQRRQRGMSLAMNKMLADVPQADVVVVNPTHYAVALKWNRLTDPAPICVAKGADEIAARIREIAAAHDVPLHSDPPSARAMFATVDIGAAIRPDHYAAVAAAIRFADDLRKRAKSR